MPIYVYEPDSGHCDDCPARFEMLEGIHAKPLKRCPACEQLVHRVIAASFGIVKGSSNPIADAQAKGFKALKRDDDGQLVDIKTRKKFKPPTGV